MTEHTRTQEDGTLSQEEIAALAERIAKNLSTARSLLSEIAADLITAERVIEDSVPEDAEDGYWQFKGLRDRDDAVGELVRQLDIAADVLPAHLTERPVDFIIQDGQ